MAAFFSPEPGIDVRAAQECIERGDVFLLDVREPVEWHAGHIEGSVNVPLGALSGRLNDLPRDRRIIAICRSGHRSGFAAAELQHVGFTVENMLGGMHAWVAAELPIEPDDGSII